MTTPDPRSLTHEELASEMQRLRSLARGLLLDSHGGEDVVQEAWLAALGRGPRALRSASLGAWLSGTVRNLARGRAREDARRHRREALAARGESVEATDDASARIELGRRLFEALDALPEPYRTAVSLRYLEGLPPRAIARRTGAPVNTVRTHVRRGLERLRAELDGDGGSTRERLLSALVPLAAPGPLGLAPLATGSTSLSLWIGTAVMSNKLILGLAATFALALALSVTLWDPDRVEPAAPEAGSAAAALGDPVALGDVAQPERVKTEPESVSAVEGEGDREALPPPTEVGGWRVGGQAVGRDGTPADGVTVTLRVYDGYDERAPLAVEGQAVTDSKGRFSWSCDPPQAAAFVTANGRSERFLCFGAERLVLLGEAAPEDLRLGTAPLDLRVTGRVVDPEGKPVPGAEVETLDRRVRTEADGRFVLLATSKRSNLRLQVRAEGYAQKRVALRPMGPGEAEAQEVVLEPEQVLRGRVEDENGAPLADVLVTPGLFAEVEVRTGADGAFRLGGYRSDRSMSVHAEKPGYADFDSSFPVSSAGEEVVVLLLRAGKLEGVVRDEAGQAIEAAFITVGNPPSVYPHKSGWSGPDGRFEVQELTPGRHGVWVTRAGYATLEVGVEIPEEGAREAWLDATMVRGVHLGGVVQDQEGRPLDDVLVIAQPWGGRDASNAASTARSDEQGRFLLTNLRAVEQRVTFLQNGFTRLEREDLELGREDHVVTLHPAGQLAGRVVDGVTGEPIQAFTIRLVSGRLETGDQALYGYWAGWSTGVPFSQTDGYFRCDEDDLEVGHVVGIEARAEGYGPAVAERVFTEVDPARDAVVLRMFQGSTVQGRVIERDSGAPIAGARVVRFSPAQPLHQAIQPWTDALETTTDGNGEFTLGELPAGTMSLAVLHDDWAMALDGPFDLGDPTQGSPRVERTIQLNRGAALDVVLLRADGTPLAGESIALYGTSAEDRGLHNRDGTTDEQGRLRLEHLAPGGYQVAWMKRGGRFSVTSLSKEVDIAPEGEHSVELRPDPGGGVRGRVSFPDGREAPEEMVVRALSMNPDRKGGRTDLAHRGDYAIEPLAPGRYLLLCTHDEGPRGAGRVSWYAEGEIEVAAEGWVELDLVLQKN